MSDYDATEMDGEEQSEDGEIVKSPLKHSPLPLSKDTADFIKELQYYTTTDRLLFRLLTSGYDYVDKPLTTAHL
uniref:Uncharacterized protein n=1 Tax=Timema tahoe TaxID=61484 RepID=A0A7R9IK14_9NEOP|nr:unnamed protein product [Timema tahoe]